MAMNIDYKRVDAIELDSKKRFSEFDSIFNFSKNIGDSHLDFGCGFGAFLKILADTYPKKQFYGLNEDKNELILAKKLYSNKNLHFLRSQNLSSSDKFDSISFFFVLHEIPEPYKLLKHTIQKLSKGSKIFIYDFRRVGREKFKEFYKNNSDPNKGSFEEEYEKHNRWITEEFEEIIQKAGVSTVDIQNQGDFYFSYLGQKKW